MRQVLAIAFALTLPFAAAVGAQTTTGSVSSGQTVSGSASQLPQAASAQTALDGSTLGQHVSEMAPEHPLDHGALFGECVSELAITGECLHHKF